jgi:hypothetical protein
MLVQFIRSAPRRPFLATLAVVTGALSLALAPTATAEAGDPARGFAGPALPADAVTVHVQVGAPADGSTDGTALDPFPSLERAMAAVTPARRNGHAVRIVVGPGVYRETLAIGHAGTNPPPLVVEPAEPGTVHITGADLETRWTPVAGSSGLVSAPWDQDWGLTPVPRSWTDADVHVADGARRRENVLVDGAPLVQVERAEDLIAGSFHVDEAGDRIVMQPPAHVGDVTQHRVEVARRPFALRVSGGAANVTVRGLVFEGAAAPFERHMAYVTDARNVLIEGNTFRHASWGGLGFASVERVTVRGNHAVANGGNGIDTYKTRDAVLEGNVVAGNNVRGARHGYTGWSVAGSKNLLLHRAVFRGNTYDGNLARGLWFDTDVRDVLIDGDVSCHNTRDGLFVEDVQGPLTIDGATFCENRGAGVAVASSGDLTVRASTLSGNDRAQLLLTGDRDRSWVGGVLGTVLTSTDVEDVTLVENRFTTPGTAPIIASPVLTVDEFRERLRAGEIEASANTWSRPDLATSIVLSSQVFPLAEWDALTGDRAAAPTPTTAPDEP